MAARIGVFALAYFLGSVLSRDLPPELIVWNVGQGQWVTILSGDICWHLDMGGEFAPWRMIRALCHSRENRVSLSHWDMDHIVFAPKAGKELPDLCLLNAPLGRAQLYKEQMVLTIPRCAVTSPFYQWSTESGKSANQKSWVVLWQNVLAPGDSTRSEEKKWIHRLKGLGETRYFVLGHHGSKTSTSEDLLAKLSRLKLAIASARKRRYGHPHPEVVSELVRRKIPLLRTEDWGTIRIRLD